MRPFEEPKKRPLFLEQEVPHSGAKVKRERVSTRCVRYGRQRSVWFEIEVVRRISYCRTRRRWNPANRQFLPFTVCLQLADTFAEREHGPTKRNSLRPWWHPLKSCTGCLYRVAPSQILFVQCCVWANFSTLWAQADMKSKRVDYEVMARDYVKMACWDYRSCNRTPSQASSVP